MGFLDKFKKKAPLATTAATVHYEHPLLEIVGIVCCHDSVVLAEARACIENPLAYHRTHLTDDEAEDIVDSPESMQWLGAIDILKRHDYACECDWKDAKDDFLWQLRALKNMQTLPVNDKWLDACEDIPAWAATLTQKWRESNATLAAFDIDSDSYVLFVCTTDTLAHLSTLAEEIGNRIDDATNM